MVRKSLELEIKRSAAIVRSQSLDPRDRLCFFGERKLKGAVYNRQLCSALSMGCKSFVFHLLPYRASPAVTSSSSAGVCTAGRSSGRCLERVPFLRGYTKSPGEVGTLGKFAFLKFGGEEWDMVAHSRNIRGLAELMTDVQSHHIFSKHVPYLLMSGIRKLSCGYWSL
ncbi:hypothetical protein AOLI_G00269120 [Acnodon oligacanthus]